VSGLSGRRIAILNWRDPWHHLAGGSERYAWELARALRDAGAVVEFWTARDRYGGQRQAARDRVEQIELRRLGGTFGFYPLVLARLLGRRLARSRRFDLVVDMDCGIPLFSPFALARRTPVVLVVHHVHLDQFSTHFNRPLAQLGRFLEGRLMPIAYRRARTVAVSDSTATEMRERLAWRGLVDIVPNGTDAVVESTDVSEPDRVAVLGRLVAHKRVDAVVQAIARLARQRPSVRLDIIGAGPDADRLSGLVTELDVADRVLLHGFVKDDELGQLLGRARLHVCASDAEGWGLVVLAAAAHGIPTLARDVPGLRDSVRAGDTGWLLAPEVRLDQLPEALAQGVAAALDELSDDVRRRELAARCRAWANQHTWPQMHSAIVGVVTQEMDRSASGSGRRDCDSPVTPR
jgi:glycosyltransferase involved in cell wall biosynthesis